MRKLRKCCSWTPRIGNSSRRAKKQQKARVDNSGSTRKCTKFILVVWTRPLCVVHVLKNAFPLNLIWGTQTILNPWPHDYICYWANPVHYVLFVFWRVVFPQTSSEVHTQFWGPVVFVDSLVWYGFFSFEHLYNYKTNNTY